ncbi:MAG: response regulator transcription factor [Lachnospiraceae bacterium]|nr:response regulator transcription factor [Lachnospiraceae bacterium]
MQYTDVQHHLTIFICEDIAEDSTRLSDICEFLSEDYAMTVECFLSAESLKERLENIQQKGERFPNLILMDIELPGMDGITLGKQIKQMSPDVFLVFVTAYIEYAVKGYEASAFRYLLKPLSVDVMRTLITDIQAEYMKKKKLLVKTKHGEMVVSLQDLLYISAEDKYTVLYTKSQHFISDYSLKKYEEQLRGQGFFRIHRKYLVNLYHHQGIRSSKVVLSNDCVLPISKKRMSEYQKQLFRYLGEDIV